MFDAFLGCLSESILNGTVKWGRYPHVKPTPDKSDTQRFPGDLSQLDADPAKDAFPGFEDDSSRLDLLLEITAL
jgi:hypothetical protein